MINNGGSSTLRNPPNIINNTPRAIEEIDEDPPLQPIKLGGEVIMPSHGLAPPENAGKNVLSKNEKAQPTSNSQDNKTQSDWDVPEDSVFTTTPAKGINGSDEEGAAFFQSYPAGYSDIKKAEEPTRQEKEIEVDEKKEARRQRREKREAKSLKRNEITITNVMLIDELNKHPNVLSQIKKDKVRGINRMSIPALKDLFEKYIEDPLIYFGSGKHVI